MRDARAILIGIAVLAVLAPAEGSAQTSGSIQTSTTVLSAITVTAGTLQFGKVQPTQTKTVSAAVGERFVVAIAPAAPVMIGYTLPSDCGFGIGLNQWIVRAGRSGDIAAAAPLEVRGMGGMYPAHSPAGALYLWFGATLRTRNASPGAYTAPIKLTVSYL
jgi:hypothetical protein